MTKKGQTAIPEQSSAPVRVRVMEPLNNSNQEFFSWSQQGTGTKLEGFFQGKEPSKFEGDNYIIDIDGKQIKFSASAGLKSLEDVRIGAFVSITHLGMRQSKNGKQYRSFDIQVEKGGKKEQGQVTP